MLKTKNSLTPEARAARSAAMAAWAAWGAFLLSIVLTTYNVYSDLTGNIPAERIAVDASRYFGDYPTQLSRAPMVRGGRVGLISVLWRVVVANNGAADVSLTTADVVQLEGTQAVSKYSRMFQGFFDQELQPINFPINLAAGHSKQIFLRINVWAGGNPYDVAIDKFGEGSVIQMSALIDSLQREGIDLHGNPVYMIPNGGGYTTRSEDLEEQVFLLSIKTARGTVINDLFSWYTYSVPTL